MKLRNLAASALSFVFVSVLFTVALLPTEAQGTFTTLHSFGLTTGDGQTPEGALLQGADGALYGTTSSTNPTGNGVIYKYTTKGVYSILHTFGDGTVKGDGLNPASALTEGADGNYYGTTTAGGSTGNGTIYKLTQKGVLTIVHSFANGTTANDALSPAAPLVLGPNGILYGTSADGGSAGDGTVYSLSPSGIVTILHSFGDGTVSGDGISPSSALIFGADGNLYGTTYAGGTAEYGTIYRITPAGVVTILHSFSDGSVANDGAFPVSGLAIGSDGNFYGTTTVASVGGEKANAAGAVFRMTPAGVVTTLHVFTPGTSANDGSDPNTTLVEGADGNLYGTTDLGGSGHGTIYRVATTGTVTTIWTFPASIGFDDPIANLIEIGNIMYGVTKSGGDSSLGTIFDYNLGVNASFVAAPTPTISPNGGTFKIKQFCTLTDSLAGAAIYYTTDGTVPTTASTLYSSPFAVSSTQTINAIAVASGYLNSAVASATITVGVPTTGSFTAGLHFMSMPDTYTGVSLDTLFGYSGVKLAVWNPLTVAYAVTPSAPANQIVAGQAYWVRFPNAITISALGAPTAVTLPFTIQLQPGWNMVGDPFNVSVPVSQLTFAGGSVYIGQPINAPLVSPNVYGYDTTTNTYVLATSLDPEQGYWIYATSATDMTVNLPTGF